MSRLLNSKWGAIALWLVVMYVVAYVWHVTDSNDWWAIPTYFITGVLWVGSLLWALSFFVEWTGERLILKSGALGSGSSDKPQTPDPP